MDLWFSYRGYPYGLQDALPRSVICLLCSEEGCIKGSAPINLSDRLHQVLRRAEFFCTFF
ncbi:putative cellulose synthase [Helianthus anomalus]